MQDVSEIYGITLRSCSVHKNNEESQRKTRVPWTACFRAVARLKRKAPCGVYGAILKVLCYARAVNDAAELQQRAEGRCELIGNTTVIFERVRQPLMRRAVRCVEAQGQHYEQFCN
jgi:hypothetical protein